MTWVQIPPPSQPHDLATSSSLSVLLTTGILCEDGEVLILQGSQGLMSSWGWEEPAAGAGSAISCVPATITVFYLSAFSCFTTWLWKGLSSSSFSDFLLKFQLKCNHVQCEKAS